jgi:glutathione S-transferase
MKFYWCANTRAFRIAWLLEEAGVRYERVVIDIHDAAAKSDPAFRAVSPMGKVPALQDGAGRLSDSGAICIYVADQYTEARLAPTRYAVRSVPHGSVRRRLTQPPNDMD